MTTYLLYNKRARQAAANDDVAVALIEAGVVIDKTFELDKSSDINQLCKKIVADKPGLLIVASGDGTISRVLHHVAGSTIQVGVIPLGTTNNFARSLGIPLTIDEAIATIMQTKAHSVDLGIVNDQYFANVVGIGLSTQIAKQVSNSTKRRWGRAAYAITGLRLASKHRPFAVHLTDKDNEIHWSVETHQVIVANGRFHAGRVIAQDATLDNSELVVFAIGGRSLWSFSWQILSFYFGRQKKIIHTSYVAGRDMRLTTSRQEVVEIDGEAGITTPLSLQVAAGIVQVRYRL